MVLQSIRRRWFQWRLRTLFGVLTLCAVVTAISLAPRVRERAVIAWLQKQDAGFTLEPAGPDWLRRLIGDKFLQNVVAVQIWETPIARTDLSRFDDLPCLRELRFMRSVLCDSAFAGILNEGRLHLPTMAGLTVADIEQFADRRPEVDCDIAFAESLYQASLHSYQLDPNRQLRDVLFACQTAARWKIGCAEYKLEKTAAVNAYRQLIHWLERIDSHVAGSTLANPAGGSPSDVALAKCVIMAARLKLSRAQESSSAERAACHAGSAAAAELLRLIDPEASGGPIDLYQFEFAWSNAIELLLAKARLDGGEAAEQKVLQQQVHAFRKLKTKLENLYLTDFPGGEVEKFELARINLALAEARLAHALLDKNAEQRVLRDALHMAEHLRLAIYACYEVGTIRGADVLYADARATELETAYAQLNGDAESKRRVTEMHRVRIERFWRKRVALSLYSVGGMAEYEGWIGCLLRCLLAVDRVENEGRAAFDSPVSSFAPRWESPSKTRAAMK